MSVISDLSKGALKAIREIIVAEVKQDLAGVKQDVSVVKQDLAGVKQDVSGVKQDVNGVKQDMTGVKQDVAGLKQDMTGVKQDVAGLKQDMTGVKGRLAKIEQTQFDMRLEHSRDMGKISGQLEFIARILMGQHSAHQGQPQPPMEELREDPAPYNVDKPGKGKPSKPGDSGA